MKTNFVMSALFALLVGCNSFDSENASLDTAVKGKVFTNKEGQLCYNVTRNGATIIETSVLGLDVDGEKLGENVTITSSKPVVKESVFEWNGVKNEVNLKYSAQSFLVTQNESGKTWTLESRTFNDGFAFRYVVESPKSQVIKKELTTWTIPVETNIWHHINQPQYEKYWGKNKLPEIEKGYNSQLPITLELPDNSYAAITEAGGFTHSGLSLTYDGTQEIGSFYAGNKNGWTVKGAIKTPWRIIMTGPSLNDLVNCDIVPAVSPAPDKTLFPEGSKTDWIKPGRSLWQWWGYWNAGTEWKKQQWFVDQAAELGCQYYMVDEGWEQKKQGWITETRTSWEALKELSDYAKTKDVKLLVWRSWYANTKKEWPGLETFEQRKDFFENCVKAGVYGAKIDFLGSESVARRTYVRDVLKEAAGYKLLINFHGSPKPTGENRTYPNEVTREGIKGLEHNKWSEVPPTHYATTQFTRLLAGHGDFTPTTFQPEFLKGTTCTLQLASAITYTSSVLHWADKPDVYLASSAVDLIRTMPTTWDETKVLPGSKIGDLSVFARRKGKDWYVAVINGAAKRSYTLDLSFLGEGNYSTTIFKDVATDNTKMASEETTVTSSTKIKVELNAGGGFVAVIKQ